VLFQSEKLLGGYKSDTVVVEYTTYGKYTLPLYVAGVYQITMVGAGGLSQGVYGGDCVMGGWTGFQVQTGGCGAYVDLLAFLKPDKYTITIGALGGGTDLTSTTYSSVKTPGSSQGAKSVDSIFSDGSGTSLIVAGGGGYGAYGYCGNQKNDGARYVFTTTGSGGVVSKSDDLIVTGTPILQNGSSAAQGNGGDWAAAASKEATWNGYGKPNTVSGSYAGYYDMSYTVYSGTGGYFRLIYKRNSI